MKQLMFDSFSESTQTIVNTATVKHRSPFRYPGGKTWLVHRIYKWLLSKNYRPELCVEPFAGGAIVGLSIVFEQLVDHVLLVELDEQVADVWETIINTDKGFWLAEHIQRFPFEHAAIDTFLAQYNLALHERALQTIIKNRINRGGILASGAGRIKHGEKGKGIRSRWYPETLATRIRDIVAIKDQLSFLHGDGLHLIKQYADNPCVVFFVDPPYTASTKKPGKRLYNYSNIDHRDLFNTLATVAGDFLLTYDNTEEMRAFAEEYNFEYCAIPMKNTHHEKLTELLIGKDLSWLAV